MANDCSTGTFAGFRASDGEQIFIRGDCGKRGCKRCGPKRAKRYRAAIARRAGEYKLTRFVSLTLDPAKLGKNEESVSYLRECFSKFRVYLQRKCGKSIKYIAVVELQKSGMAHLHVLVDQFIDQRWLSEAWQAVGGGRIVDIRYVDVHRISAYLAKYLAGDKLLAPFPRGKRQITTCRAITLFERKVSSGWQWVREHIRDLHVDKFSQGITHGEKWDDAGLQSFYLRAVPEFREGP